MPVHPLSNESCFILRFRRIGILFFALALLCTYFLYRSEAQHQKPPSADTTSTLLIARLKELEQNREVMLRNTLIAITCAALALVMIFANRSYLRKQAGQKLKAQNQALSEANQEIERQQRILEDQAAEIELANAELSESNLHLQRLNGAIQSQIQELETLDSIVKTINRETDTPRLLQTLLEQGHLLLPSAEKGSVLALDHDNSCYRFVAFHGYSHSTFADVVLTHEEMERRYTGVYGLEGGVYVVTDFPANTPEGQKFTIAPPACALLITIPIAGSMEGILFFDNFSSPTAFSEADIVRCRHYREHIIAAFSKARTLSSMQQTASELALRNTMLQTLNTEKNEFLGIAAHDMKNPLAQIMMSAGLMKRYADRMEAQEIVQKADQIEMTAMRMNRIISKLLDINAIETGTMQVQLANIPLQHAMEVVVRDLRSVADRKGIVLVEEYAPEADSISILADPMALRSIIENVGSNAIKYSPHHTTIRFKLMPTTGAIRLAVSDQGPGISAEDMPKLFGKFARLSAKPTGGENSTGLGLSIVKTLVETLHGRIWCESEEGSGATFIIEFPL
ncbi:MAG: ATP-binding protein [Candidatus Kapaibacteriota bacterium]